MSVGHCFVRAADFVRGTAPANSRWGLQVCVVECEHDWRLCGPATELSIRIEDVRAAMRKAFEDRAQTNAKRKAASEFVHERFTWPNTARLMTQRLKVLTRSEQTSEQAGEVKTSRSILCQSVSLCVPFQNDEYSFVETFSRMRPLVDEILALDVGGDERSAEIRRE